MTTPFNIPKAIHLWHEAYTLFTPPAYYKSEPYEYAELIPTTYNQPLDTVILDDVATSADKNHFSSYTGGQPGFHVRTDTYLSSVTLSGNGGQCVYQTNGSIALQSAYKAGRGLATYIREYQNPIVSQSTTILADNHAINMYILPDGRASVIGALGKDDLSITTATPDKFLQHIGVEKQAFARYELAQAARSYTASMPRDEAHLGFPPLGTGPFTADPFAGFGTYFDSDLNPAEAFNLHSCNSRHLLGAGNADSVAPKASMFWANYEVLAHHVLVDRQDGNGYKSILSQLPNEIQTGNDIEDKLPEANVGPCSAFDILQSMCDENSGLWRWWFDARSKLHVIRDYPAYAYTDTALTPFLLIKSGRSLVGELKITIGDERRRLLRKVVQAQYSSVAASDQLPLNDHFNNGFGIGLYPPGTGSFSLTVDGQASRQDGYHGYQDQIMAHWLYSKHSKQATFEWSGFFHPSLALACFNRVVGINYKDPNGLYDFTEGATSQIGIDVGNITPGTGTYSSNGKLFSCDSVSVQNVGRQNGGTQDLFYCTISGTEIIPLITG